MKATAMIERGADGTYGIYVFSSKLPFGVIGDGRTVEEARADFQNSLEEMKKYYESEGKIFPDVEFEFVYDTASFLQQYAYAFTLAGLERITGINQRQLSHYINGVRKPKRSTVQKIETRLHAFGKEISTIRFFDRRDALDAKIKQGIADNEAGKVYRMGEDESTDDFLGRMLNEG